MPRFFLPETPIHVIVRGNNRGAIAADNADREFLRGYLQHAACTHGVAVHAYVLMTNHVHILATPARKDSLPRMIQSLGRVYVRYYNDKHLRTGTLWEGRYKAAIVDEEEYLLLCMRYIELNPVRAGMVRNAGDYAWSSFRANALGARDNLLRPHALYLGLGENVRSRCTAYRAALGIPIAEADLARIRDATQNAWGLGNERFQRELDARVRRGHRLPVGRRPNSAREQFESDPHLAKLESDPN